MRTVKLGLAAKLAICVVASTAAFFSLFGLSPETQQKDIEGIEHHLSPATADVIADLAQFFEDHPDILKLFLKSRKAIKD